MFDGHQDGHSSRVSTGVVAPDLFDQPPLWRVEAAASLGLAGEELIAAVSPGPAFPGALRSLTSAVPRRPRFIVDLGAGGGGPSEWMRVTTGATVYAVEPMPGAREAAGLVFPELRVLDGRADHAPLPDGVAEVVMLSGVLSLLDDIEAVIDEVERLLASSGCVAVADLFSGSSTTWSTGPNTFRSIDDITRTLRRRGFRTTGIGRGGPLPDPSWSAIAQAVDDWIDAHCSGREGYDDWSRDRGCLQDHARSGSVIGGYLAAGKH